MSGAKAWHVAGQREQPAGRTRDTDYRVEYNTVRPHEALARNRPKRLRLRLLSIAGRLAVTGRRRWLHRAAAAPFLDVVLDALRRLDALAAPG